MLKPHNILLFSLAAGFLFVYSIANSSEKAKYLWPVKENKIEVTSVFCDKRVGHPHGGIDVSLLGKVGQTPIISVDAGVLMRIRDSKYGYGKVVYVRMADKKIAVYAHLDSFSPKLQKIAQQIRKQTGLEKLDYYYEEWEMNVPISRGELIGMGGKSGTSTAHLHFELRYDDIVNLNPLTNGFSIEDSIKPKIFSILFVPVDQDASIDGKANAKTIPVSNLNKPVKIAGRVGIAVNTKDKHRQGGRNFSPYRIAVFVDGVSFFETKYETWGYVDQNIRSVQYDSDGNGDDYYYRAYNPYPVSIPFFSKPNSGTFDQLDPGIHDVRIEVSDANRNVRTIEFQIDTLKPEKTSKSEHVKNQGSNILFNNTSVKSESGVCTVSGNEFSFFEPVRIDLSETLSAHPQAVGKCIFVEAPSFIVRRSFNLTFTYDEQITDQSHLGVYRYTDDEWKMIGNDVDLSTHTITGQSELLGKFCLISDEDAPKISDIKLFPKSKTPLRFTINDEVSGLARNFVLATVDGETAIVSFSPKTGKGSARIDQNLKPGPHTLVITAIDRAGNIAEKSLKFVR